MWLWAFFYGGANGAAQELATELGKRYPDLHVTATHSPPFREAGEMVDLEVIERINSTFLNRFKFLLSRFLNSE
jgi:UDP-N-acetyl-D-mannosaminuronic acid transferase (WecB/TagA/CpsF family)